MDTDKSRERIKTGLLKLITGQDDPVIVLFAADYADEHRFKKGRELREFHQFFISVIRVIRGSFNF